MLVTALAIAGVSDASAATPLEGTFTITAGANPPGSVGSYFRMIFPGGTVNSGFIPNSTSGASDRTYTYLSPGTDGGLVTGGYQPEPTPAFDGHGNSLAARIISPTAFNGPNFSADTAAIDPQTATAVPAPAISDDGAGNLSGDLRAFAASWNNQEFNQGSPKPDGGLPGLTAGPTGTYNAVTGAYTLDWTSKIIGGPFDGFTGKWHLEGTFVPFVQPNATPTATPLPLPACVGDCDGSGAVTISELLLGVNIVLGSQPLSACPAFDVEHTGHIEISELIAAVNSALAGCTPVADAQAGTSDPIAMTTDGNIVVAVNNNAVMKAWELAPGSFLFR